MRLPEIVLIYTKRLDAMSLRERVLIFLAAVAIVVLIADSALLEPILRRQRINSQLNQQQQDEIRTMQTQLQAYAQARVSEGAKAKRQRFEKRKTELVELDRELSGKQGELVTPDRMTRMLSEILKRSPEVELISLRALPPTSLTQVPGQSGAAAALYRHGIEITVSGTYFRMLGYVSELERNRARIFWGDMDLQAGTYPIVTLKVTLYTLSPEKTWLLI